MANLRSTLPPPTNLPFFSFIFLPLIWCLSLLPQSPLLLHWSPGTSGSFTVALSGKRGMSFKTLDCAVYKLHIFISSLAFPLHSWQRTRYADCHDNSKVEDTEKAFYLCRTKAVLECFVSWIHKSKRKQNQHDWTPLVMLFYFLFFACLLPQTHNGQIILPLGWVFHF